MSGKLMLIDQSYDLETRVAIVEGAVLYDFDYEFVQNKLKRGNIYLAEVKRVEPSLQAAFVDYGEEKHGFLAFSEIHLDYYQSDKKAKAAAVEKISEPSIDEETGTVVHRPPPSLKIQDTIKRGQIMLVQVIKDVRGTKGAAFTTYISLPGKYIVFMPNTPKGTGISRKITSAEDREGLKKIVDSLEVPEKMSLLVRTAGLGKRKTDIKKDYDYLMRLWSDIEKKVAGAEAPTLISEESDLLTRALRDLYDPDIDEILIQGDAAYKKARAFMRMFMPSHVKRVTQYDKGNLFQSFGIDDQIAAIYSNTVALPSGGSIVINSTEALVAIDVNSARATKERHIDETAIKTNLEAATTIARQLRLRDLSGLIVIDFIDMPAHKNALVEKALKEALKMDRARIQIGKISQFGLLELSRQRLRQSLLESSSTSCPYCQGRGQVLSIYAISLNWLHQLEKAARVQTGQIVAEGSPQAVSYLLNEKRAVLVELENRYQVSIYLKENAQLHLEEFIIEDPSQKETASLPKKSKKPSTEGEAAPLDENNTQAPKNGRRGNRHKRKQGSETQSDDNNASISMELPDAPEKTNEDAPTKPKRSRRRSRRKIPAEDTASPVEAPTEPPAETTEAPTKPKRSRRGRGKRKPNSHGEVAASAQDNDTSISLELPETPPKKQWWKWGSSE